MKNIKDLDIQSKKVFIRTDFNVPLDKNLSITDDSRIVGALPTIQYALEQNAKIIIASHLGRPKGKPVAEMSMKPVVTVLSNLLDAPVKIAPDCIGDDVKKMVNEMKDRDILILENLRFHPGETDNDETFAKALAELCDVYINDAFAVSHRAHASVEAITHFAAISGAGLLLQKELDYFEKAMDDPERPLVAVIGGAKVSSKLLALENMLKSVDKIIIGGAMANTFLKSIDCFVGSSLVEDDLLWTARTILKNCLMKGIKYYVPIDVVIAKSLDASSETAVVPVGEIPSDWIITDIGPATRILYAEAMQNAKTIIWNGPMGIFEMEPFSQGTMAVAETIAHSNALTIVGGGDTDAALHKSGNADKVTYISTGGGAFLKLMEGKQLPAVAALANI